MADGEQAGGCVKPAFSRGRTAQCAGRRRALGRMALTVWARLLLLAAVAALATLLRTDLSTTSWFAHKFSLKKPNALSASIAHPHRADAGVHYITPSLRECHANFGPLHESFNPARAA